MRWGSLLLCLLGLGVTMVPWVHGAVDAFLLFFSGMNLQAFFESIEEKVKP